MAARRRGPRTVTEVSDPVTSEGASPPRTVQRLLVAGSLLVVFTVVLAGFARLGGMLGLTEPLIAPPPSRPAPALSGEPVAAPGGATGLTVTLPADPSPTPTAVPPPIAPPPPAPGATTPVTAAPAATTTGNPPRWPASLPALGEHRLISAETDPDARWVVALPGSMALAGGRFLAALAEKEWDTRTVTTTASVTAVGTRGEERLSVVVRPAEDLAPAGWVLLEVIHQERVPAFQPPPTSSVPADTAVTRRS